VRFGRTADVVHAAGSAFAAIAAAIGAERSDEGGNPMARRPLLPERGTFLLGTIGGLVAWLGATGVAGSVLPDAGAHIAGVLAGMVALVAIPTLLGRPEAGVMLLGVVGGLAVVIGFVSQYDLGPGRAVAIFLPASIVLVALVWATRRFLPGARAGSRS
jgi:hypothetical protein